MSPLRQTSWSLVAVAVLLLASSGCSSAELASNEFDQGEFSGDGDGDGDPTGSAESETTEGDTGDGDGEDEGTEPPGLEDPGLELGSCDPAVAQALIYDLADAQAEAAAVLVRESVLSGSGEVPSIPISPQPFLNHFEFNYPPVEGPQLQIVGELWKPQLGNIDAPPRYRLQVAIRGPQMSAEQRTPVDLVIVVDLGPSMAGEPLGLAEEALGAIEAALVAGDRVTLIAAGEQPQILTASTLVDNESELLSGLLAAQSPAGVADVAAALELAYETVTPAWEGQGQPRVLLISNGHFQLDGALVELVEEHAADGRYLVALGLGAPEGFSESSLRQLAAEGRGPLLYGRTADELWIDMQARFTEHMVAIAIDLEVTLSLPPGLAIRDRDQLTAKVGEPELALLGPDDTIVFHHELESCVELDPNAVVRFEVAWTDPASLEPKQTVWEQPVGQLGYGSMDTRKGAATVAYARALRGYRDGRPQGESYGALLDAISLIAEALEAQPEDADLIEMSQVLGKLEG
jgi:hypothetical protein